MAERINADSTGCGKFETSGTVGEYFYDCVLSGGADDTVAVEYDLVTFEPGQLEIDYGCDDIQQCVAAIVTKDFDGFIRVKTFDDPAAATRQWDAIVNKVVSLQNAE